MAHDYEDIFDIDDLDDDELRLIVKDTLRDNHAVDHSGIKVLVRSGTVVLAGRVGTDEEKRVAERVVADRIGLQHVSNRLLVDPARRAESPEAIDTHLADEARHESLLLGDAAPQEEDETRHLGIDHEGELYGTVDRAESLENGIPWYPPESPTPEGTDGTDTPRDANSPF